jgi:cell division protease FtsH
LNDVENGGVQYGKITQDKLHITYKRQGEADEESMELPVGNRVLDTFVEAQVPVYIEPKHWINSPLDGFTLFFELILIVSIVRIIFASMSNNPQSNAFKFGSWTSSSIAGEAVDVKFQDVAGVDAAKEELQDIVDFLKNSTKYIKMGAKIPKGVLLSGPPGTGKTLLARAIAGEAGVPFFSCSGSQFVEMFVGVGASRIRDLFKQAKEQAPCIVFIDEIDAIGKARGPSITNNDERDQTINQLLTAMDGFTENNGVIVLGATNRAELLDEALLRPGRFDRKVTVDLPDLAGRKAILGIHTRNKPLGADVSLDTVARNTTGFSGADLANLANEAAIYAAREGAEVIQYRHWDMSFEKSILGQTHPSMVISEKQRKILAVHEAGHALLGVLMSDFDKVRKVSIIPRGGAGGVTYFEPQQDRIDMQLYSREYLENQIIVSLGGRVAEEIVFGTTQATTGASGDLETVMDIAYNMVATFGFNETLGAAAWGSAQFDISADIFSEVRLIVESCTTKAFELLSDNEYYLRRIADALMEKETLNESDIYSLLEGISTKLTIRD